METISQLNDAGAQGVLAGRIKFSSQADSPLLLAYVVVLICMQGNAAWNVNSHSYLMEEGDFLVLSEDSIAVIKNSSENFSCNCYLINRAIAAEIADGLPTSLFIYLAHSPFFKKVVLRPPTKWHGSNKPK